MLIVDGIRHPTFSRHGIVDGTTVTQVRGRLQLRRDVAVVQAERVTRFDLNTVNDD
jgi:hypothetical protein